MTIIYLHGVKVRDPQHGITLGRPFMRWLGPKVARNSVPAAYTPVYWGDIAARFRWNLASRPRTLLLKQGGGGVLENIGSLRTSRSAAHASVVQPAAKGPLLDGAALAPDLPVPPLSAVKPIARGDFLADLYLAAAPDGAEGDAIVEKPRTAALADAAASVAARWDEITAASSSDATRVSLLMQAVESELSGGLIAQGGFRDWMVKAGEMINRAGHMPFDLLGGVMGELRPVLNEFVAYFSGDVMAYLNQRQIAAGPGEIPTRVLDALANAQARKAATGEPVVVVTHSMGGQLLYDALVHFAPLDPRLKGLEVDHWISCGCQVSFFAELGLFIGQPATSAPDRMSRPANVARWTNYYDANDLVGFVMEPVFSGVKDLAYDTGYGLAFAHSGFLARPSFFEKVAERLESQP